MRDEHLRHLQEDRLDEGVDCRSEGLELFLADPDAVEAPEEDAAFAEDGEEVQHFRLNDEELFSETKTSSST